mmetsp:Transcript_37049/g.92919  ORF Transcript_37049/g.92919 Transcript_37049/m.92919 type:complete len:240 (-) Transcript_37049:3751-4470(-)
MHNLLGLVVLGGHLPPLLKLAQQQLAGGKVGVGEQEGLHEAEIKVLHRGEMLYQLVQRGCLDLALLVRVVGHVHAHLLGFAPDVEVCHHAAGRCVHIPRTHYQSHTGAVRLRAQRHGRIQRQLSLVYTLVHDQVGIGNARLLFDLGQQLAHRYREVHQHRQLTRLAGLFGTGRLGRHRHVEAAWRERELQHTLLGEHQLGERQRRIKPLARCQHGATRSVATGRRRRRNSRRSRSSSGT